ncbi:MAG: prepilin-type N-terminal cleavage/methylation domain-containing protein [Thermofilum sp.]
MRLRGPEIRQVLGVFARGNHPGDSRGFTLLELLVAISVLLILAAVVSPSVIKIMGSKLRENAQLTLQGLSRAAHAYYCTYGMAPGDVADLRPFLDTPVVNDPWGNPILMFSRVTVDGVLYDLVFLSKGPNTVQDSVLQNGTLEPAGDDLVQVVSLREETPFDRTRQRIALANGALEAYVGVYGELPPGCTGYSTSCVLALVSSGFLEGRDSYDLWGSLLYYLDGFFHSSGPDRRPGTDDDL